MDVEIKKDEITVQLYADKIIQNLKKTLHKREIGRSKARWNLGPERIIRDVLKITDDIVIQGWITGSDISAAMTVKDNLITIFKKGGKLDYFKWRGTTYTDYFMERLQIEDTPLVEGTGDNNAVRLRYTIGLTWGTEK